MTPKLTNKNELLQGRWYAWLFWGVVAIFTLYEFFIRVTPNAILGTLQEDLHATPGSIASSMSVYLWVYAPMQLLVGVLFDRYGTKYIVSTAAMICGIGCIIFSQADGLVAAGIGRGFIGIGSAFAFVGAVYVATVWFRPNQLAMITGITVGAGMIGDSIGQLPISELVALSSWQQVVFVSGLVGLGIGFVMLVVIPRRPAWFKEQFKDDPVEQPGLSKCLAQVLKNRQIWLIGAISAILYLPISILAALWGTTYLEKTMSIDAAAGSTLITALLVGFMIGCPIVGRVSDAIDNRKLPLIIGAIGGFITMGLFLLASHMSMSTMMVLMFIMGLCTSTQSIAFAVAIEISPRSLAATAVGVCNFITMMAAAGLQNAIGWILNALIANDAASGAGTSGSKSTYDNVTPEDFMIAMLALPALFMVSIVLCIIMKQRKNPDQPDPR